MIDTGHWIFPHDFNVEDWYGFVYRVVDIVTGREYIGKKQFFSVTRKKVKGRKNRKRITKESKWKTYTGSSTHLNAAIAKSDMEKFRFYIESLHTTKASMSYAETRMQVFEDVLRTKLDDGTPKYYNRQIGNCKFIPPEETIEESKMKISTSIVEHYSIDLDGKRILKD